MSLLTYQQRQLIERAVTGVFLLVLCLVFIAIIAVRLVYGGGVDMPLVDTGEPQIKQLQKVADLPRPPGNLAVSNTGQVFFTFHPDAKPETKLAVLKNGGYEAFPSEAWQRKSHPVGLQSPLAVRLDQRGRLWVLDNGHHGFGEPRLLAFDSKTGEFLHRFDFPADIAPLGSHLNDFQISPDGRRFYIADASIFRREPALVVYDLKKNQARRLLSDHASVRAERAVLNVQGRRMQMLGLFAIRPGVDSIALSRDGNWLYFAAVTSQQLFRIPTSVLNDESLDLGTVAAAIEPFASKVASDGMSSDNAGNLYLTDPQQSAIVLMQPDGAMRTLVRDNAIRWPDGLSFGSENPDALVEGGDVGEGKSGAWLYFTASALNEVLGKPPWAVADNAPYQIWRVAVGETAVAGQ